MNEERANPLGLGHLLPHDRARDAVHIAVIPVVAGEALQPGDRVVIVPPGRGVKRRVEHRHEWVGLVDPYLGAYVREGQRFWCFMRPGTVTAMHHNWHHDAFPLSVASDEGTKLMSEGWLRNFAERYQVGYMNLVEQATAGDSKYPGITVGTDDVHEMSDGEKSLFWHHLAVVTGRMYSAEYQGNMYWSCAC